MLELSSAPYYRTCRYSGPQSLLVLLCIVLLEYLKEIGLFQTNVKLPQTTFWKLGYGLSLTITKL